MLDEPAQVSVKTLTHFQVHGYLTLELEKQERVVFKIDCFGMLVLF